jgi:hypothetical protein
MPWRSNIMQVQAITGWPRQLVVWVPKGQEGSFAASTAPESPLVASQHPQQVVGATKNYRASLCIMLVRDGIDSTLRLAFLAAWRQLLWIDSGRFGKLPPCSLPPGLDGSMPRSRRGIMRSSMWPLAVAVILLSTVGCARWNWRGKGFDDNDDSSGWARKMRPPADETRFSGLDARSQEIERNLGVR